MASNPVRLTIKTPSVRKAMKSGLRKYARQLDILLASGKSDDYSGEASLQKANSE